MLETFNKYSGDCEEIAWRVLLILELILCLLFFFHFCSRLMTKIKNSITLMEEFEVHQMFKSLLIFVKL